jgi:hypothetical protein
MRTNLSGFRNFIEEMDPSMSKHMDNAEGDAPGTDKGDFFQAGLGGEMGMSWPDIVSTLEADPWFSANFQMGMGSSERLYKDGTWRIVKDSLTPNGADIELVKAGRSFLRPDSGTGTRLDKSGGTDKRRYHLNREELIKFLTKGWTPALQAAQAGGAGGGLPGMM